MFVELPGMNETVNTDEIVAIDESVPGQKMKIYFTSGLCLEYDVAYNDFKELLNKVMNKVRYQ